MSGPAAQQQDDGPDDVDTASAVSRAGVGAVASVPQQPGPSAASPENVWLSARTV